MNHRILSLFVSIAVSQPLVTFAGGLIVTSPLEYQVFQRESRDQGTLWLEGKLPEGEGDAEFSVTGRSLSGDLPDHWQPLGGFTAGGAFHYGVRVSSGGWYRIEIRLRKGVQTGVSTVIQRVGVGEVFVVAGQSNSTNYGSEKQKPLSEMVAIFEGKTWRIADDPQPGTQDGSTGGSFLPAFGDALFERYHVPIGVSSTGAGATSVRQWLPKGATLDRAPTILADVQEIGPGLWKSTGRLYLGLTARLKALGPHGCRAVLWHQGESDAGQARSGYPAERQISGDAYVEYLEKVIHGSQKRAGWEVPWFVAQATYHSEKDATDEEFRAAQRETWKQGLAYEGPDTDALGAQYRAGVHFNAKGLQAHGQLWAEKVSKILDNELANDAPANHQGSQRTLKPGEDGSILLHAKDVSVHGQTVRYEPDPHKNTVGFWTDAKDWVSWEFEIIKPGKFSVEILQGCGTGSGGSKVEFSVGEQALLVTVKDTGGFQNFVAREIGEITLDKAGRYTLTVKPKTKPGGAVMDLRQVTLKPIQTPVAK